jgi:hypothetical protein
MSVIDGRTNNRFLVPNQQQRARRDAPFQCACCGRGVARATLHQKFCSARCRVTHFRKNGHTAIISGGLGQATGRVTHPPKKLNGFKILQAAKSGSTPAICGPQRVIERELFAGREWHEQVSPDGVAIQVTRFRRVWR